MKNNFKILEGIDSVDKNKLEELFETSDTSSVFQTIPFYDFFNQQLNSECFAFSITENNEISISILVVILHESGFKKNLSKRAIIYGGPVLNTIENEINKSLNMLLEYVINRLKKRKVIYIETRNLHDFSLNKDTFLNLGFSYEQYVNYHIDISNLENTFMRYKAEKRRQIRKALKKGVRIQIASRKTEIEYLYNILHDLYAEKVKKPLPNLNYFMKLFELFQKYNNGFICLLVYNNKIIGGSICPFFNNTVYDWYRCGLDNKYPKLYPSTLAVYAGMSIGNEKGFKLFDFMGAGNINTPYGVRDFKSQFGGELLEHGRFIKVINPLLFKIGKLGLKIMQKIK